MGSSFVAAFANSNCGDVSPNVELGHPPISLGGLDKLQMQKHGQQQFNLASALFNAATEQVSGPVDFRLTHVDLSKAPAGGSATTAPATLGLSFAAGSREDSVPYVTTLRIDPGIVEGLRDDTPGISTVVTPVIQTALDVSFGVPWVLNPPAALADAHSHKPIAFVPSSVSPPLVPQVLPMQVLRIGQVAVIGFPGEITTMAGRRLRQTVSDAMSGAGVKYVAVGAYANDYSMYTTTAEECQSQQYEGASTLYGPNSLAAYQQAAQAVAAALVSGSAVPTGATPVLPAAVSQSRWRFRNLSASGIRLRFYNTTDTIRLVTLPNGDKTIAAGAEYSFAEGEFTGSGLSTVEQLTVLLPEGSTKSMSAGQLLTIAANGTASVGAFTLPPGH
jgi:neutral ceramidase